MRFPHAWIVAIALFAAPLAHADLILSAAPREDDALGLKTYGPLATRLSEVLGEKVVYQHPTSWAEYSEKIRNDGYDILFDGPHLTSWRMKHTDHHPVARLPGHLAFYIVVPKESKHHNDMASLRWSKVCAFATPNMTATVLLDRYRNEVSAPTLVSINGTTRDVFDELLASKCDAAVLRDQYYEKILKPEEREQLKIIFRTRKYPNQGFSVSRRIGELQREKIASVLMGDPSIKPITDRFAKQAKQFITSNEQEFKGVSDLLEGVVWGW